MKSKMMSSKNSYLVIKNLKYYWQLVTDQHSWVINFWQNWKIYSRIPFIIQGRKWPLLKLLKNVLIEITLIYYVFMSVTKNLGLWVSQFFLMVQQWYIELENIFLLNKYSTKEIHQDTTQNWSLRISILLWEEEHLED